MNYQEFIQPFYNSETKTSGLRGVQSQGETAEYFVDLAFAHEIPEEYISQPDTYRRWYTGRSNPKSTLWKEIEKAFDDKRFEEYSKELASKIDDERLIDLLLAYDIKLASGKKANKMYFAEALTYQFKAIANGKGSADEIVKQTYYSKEKPAVFGEYIRKAKETYSRMTVLGGKECLLDDCYVCNYIGTKRGVFLRNKNGLIIDATLEKLKTFDRRAETKNTLLIANGGMGKSLMLQHLFVDAAEKYSETGLLPIFIELREFSFDQVELFDIIVETVKNMDESFTPEHAHQMLTTGRCQLLLDGVDEIDPQDINSFQRKLSNFLKRYPDNQVVMTSRDCDAYSGIKGFVHLYLLPFDKSQSEDLVGRLLIEDDPAAKKTVRECIDDNFIKKDGAFVSNPMMLTFVVERHSTLQSLRAKRYLFYKEAYEAIVLDHDKDKTAYERIFRSVSDSEEFTTVFQEFCAVTFRQGIFSFDSDTFKIYFEELESKKSVENPKKLRAQSFLHDVCATACMMYEEDTDILYIDPGFQEYLFARYYAFAPSNEMKELCNTLIDQSTTTFRRWSAFRMLYEYSSDKVEVCLFIPFLDRIFKDRDDRDSFLQFIKIGYIVDDIVFEVELIKQIEINIDYILMLVNKYHDTHCEDKEILITIRKAVDSSPELRSKKALIENFINGVNEIDDVMNEWHDYVVEMREHDLQVIIEEERLKPVETRIFLENAFQEGEVKTVGTDIDKILPPVSRFGGGNRAAKKKTVIDRLMAYFEKFYGIGGNGGFIDKTEEE